MSTISSITATTDPSQTGAETHFSQLAKSFQAIGSALQSGDLSSAQSALANFEQAIPGTSQSKSQSKTSQPFGQNSQANSDYKNLTDALQSGNLSTAQKAYASLQNDLANASSSASTKSTHRGHHHHHRSSTTDSTASSTAATTTPSATSATSPTGSSTIVAIDGSLDALA